MSTDDRRPGCGTPELSVVVPVDDGSTDGTAGLVTAREDPRIRLAGVLVLAPQPNAGALRETVRKLVGPPGRWVDGVWVWDLHGPGRP
ncbi:hypothetical protein ACE6JH_18860 [Streptomyces nigra]